MRYTGLIVAVALAAVAAIVVLRMSGGSAPSPTTPQAAPVDTSSTVQIYVATTAIPLGTKLTQEMIAPQPWPSHLAVEGFLKVGGKESPVGMVARAGYQPNEPLMVSKLANPDDPNFLAAELPAGMRMITIPVNETDGVAGFVFPGDYVDLIFTHEIDQWVSRPGGEGGAQAQQDRVKLPVTETLLTNVKVLALDQRASGSNATDKNGALIIPRSASLMVSAEDAYKVRLAQKKGTVTLALRSLEDRDEQAGEPVVMVPSDISQKGETGDAADIGGDGVKVVRGAPKKAQETMGSSAPAAPPAQRSGGAL
jgi:pilus assembly protein CpaB